MSTSLIVVPAHGIPPVSRLVRHVGNRYGLWLFLCTFVLPTGAAATYYGAIAADRYVSEAQFIVRGVNAQSLGGLSVLLRTFGIDRSNDDSFAIHDYIESRDAVTELQRTMDLRTMFGSDKADYLTRFGTPLTGSSNEALYRFYLRRVTLVESIETGITTLRVSTPVAEDSRTIASHLLELSEQRVNAINARAREDALSAAENAIRQADDEIVAAQIALTGFRNAELLISPEQAAAGNLEVIASLTQELVEEQVRLSQMRTSSPSNPNIPASQERVRSLELQVAAERAKLTGSDTALAGKLSKYEELLLRRTLAERSYETAANSLDQARQDASRKQIYLEALVKPHLADESRDPLRLRMILTCAVVSFVAFIMLYLLVAGSREHLNSAL
jgi:capsular polysaccharide transport system permease protein